MDLRLQPGKEAQCDEVGHGDGQHVGPDEPGHDVAVEQHVWQGRAAQLSQNLQLSPSQSLKGVLPEPQAVGSSLTSSKDEITPWV